MEMGFLEECGLTKGESKTYMALVELGSTTAGPIIKKTKMQRSGVYFCLESLIERGLVSYVTKNNTKYFEAENPEKVYSLIQSKITRLKNSRTQISEYLKYLKKEKREQKEEAKVFRGWGGMKSAFDDVIKSLSKGDDLFIYGVITREEVFPRFRRFMAKFNQRRIEHGFRLNVIMNEKLKDTLGADREKEPDAHVRYLPAELQTPSVVYLYKNKVILGIWKEEPIAFVIESEDTNKSFKRYFGILWGMAKSRKQYESRAVLRAAQK